MIVVILLLVFAAVTILGLIFMPMMANRGEQIARTNAAQFVAKYDAVLTNNELKFIQKTIVLAPIALAAAGFILFPPHMQMATMFIGVIIGILAPRIRLNQILAQRKSKFLDQLMDALMIMSSSFRGGLSLIQAVESVVEEMPDPIKQEFGIVLGENKMGVSLEESLNRLYKRMPSAGLQQMISAILLARETGGNLALIFSRITNTMRERKKIEQNLKTLTVQGRIQAVVMTGLPVLLYLGVSTSNPHFFDNMKTSPMGQKMLLGCAVFWVLGALSIWKISAFKDN